MWWDDLMKQLEEATCCTSQPRDIVADEAEKGNKKSRREAVPGCTEGTPQRTAYENHRYVPADHEQMTTGSVTVSSFGPKMRKSTAPSVPLGSAKTEVGGHGAGRGQANGPGALPAPPPAVDITLTLGLDYGIAGGEGSPQREEFNRALVSELKKASGIPTEVQTQFVIKRVAPGSVVVDLTIIADPLGRGPSPSDVAADLQQQAASPTSLLRLGKVTRYTQAAVLSQPAPAPALPISPPPQPVRLATAAPEGMGGRELPGLPQQATPQHQAPDEVQDVPLHTLPMPPPKVTRASAPRMTRTAPPPPPTPQPPQPTLLAPVESSPPPEEPARAAVTPMRPESSSSVGSSSGGGKVGVGIVFDNRWRLLLVPSAIPVCILYWVFLYTLVFDNMWRFLRARGTVGREIKRSVGADGSRERHVLQFRV